MYIQGTRDAIGLPFTYVPDDYTRNSATDLTTAAFLALMADFVSAHRAELTAAGIVIYDGPGQPGADPDAGAPPPVEADETTDPEEDTAPAADDMAGDDAADEDEEPAPKKKKKKRPAPASMTTGGCSMTTSGSSPAGHRWPAAFIGLGVVVASIRARRRQV